jgi:hypothetical protein
MNYNRSSTVGSALLVLSLSLAGCSTGGSVDDAGPVFALEREVTSDIQDVDPSRTDVLSAPALRSLLQHLLTEHSDLSVLAMRQAIDGEDLAPTVEALTGNTDRLTLAIGTVYGREGAEAFDQLWTNHIEFFNDYAAALGVRDRAAADEAIQALGHYEGDFSSFIDVATAGNADFNDVLHVLHSHVQHLLGQADAWADDDYALAFDRAEEANRHMDVIAAALASGISIQQPAAFPGSVNGADAEVCAGQQLEASLLVSARLASETATPEVKPVAEAALASLTTDLDSAIVALVDDLMNRTSSPPAQEAGARRVALGQAATDEVGSLPGCTALLVGD